VSSIEFSAPTHHTAPPMEWTSELQAGDAVLSAGAAANIDRSIVRSITVPASGDRTLVFDTKYNIELDWDFGIVQISTDGGLRWTSIDNATTTTVHNGGALGSIVSQLPGFSGVGDWSTQTFDLSAYAGQTVLLRFRMMTDTFQLGNNADESGAGWWIDDVRVGGTLVSDGTLAGWATPQPPIEGYTVQLVAFNGASQTILAQVPLTNGRTASLSGGKLRRLIGDEAGTVGAIVTYDESTQSITAYAPYQLRVNGVLQPGG
jgi:bacillopeptidase F (M6 metalloprotease family)